MLNKKTLINNKNTKKSENKGLTPAVDMIGYTDIMINNTNKKENTMITAQHYNKLRKYNYGEHCNVVAKLVGKFSFIDALEKSLQEKYKSVQKERKVKATLHEAYDGSTYFTYDGCKLNGKNEWFGFNKEQLNDVLKNFHMA